MKFDTYTLFARTFPALLSMVPFYVFHFYFLSPMIGDFWGSLLAVQIASDVTFSAVLFFFLLQAGRIISKEFIEKKVYNAGLNFPTTNYLMHLDEEFSSEYTLKLHAKIKRDFKINIPSSQSEQLDNTHSRKLICEAVNHIRYKVKKGNLVGQHNTEYGFARNFAGCSVIATIISFVNLVFFTFVFPISEAFWISLILFIAYGSYTIYAKKVIDSVGRNYAQVLIQEYMGS